MNSNLWKYLALGALGIYVYQVAQKNGGTLAGNKEGIRPLNADKIVDSVMPWVKVGNPILDAAIKHGAKSFLNGLNNPRPSKYYKPF
jgi:hypothetical protein